MFNGIQSTPYTPIFPSPPEVRTSPSFVSKSHDYGLTSSDDLKNEIQKPYIERLKERHLHLASLPEELCPPSRETSPEAEIRIKALKLRMRKAHELRIPLELTLKCSGVRGGDWVGQSSSDEERDMELCLPDTEEEWFEWERRKKVAREKRKASRIATEHRKRIAKWSEGIQESNPVNPTGVPTPSQERCQPGESNMLAFTVVKRADMAHSKDKRTTSRYFLSQPSPPCGSYRKQSDHCSSIPPAPVLEALSDSCDSFSPPNSPLSIPDDTAQDPLFPEDKTTSPSFAPNETSTPLKQANIPEPVHQLSSPISPPRSLRPLRMSQKPSLSFTPKRPRVDDEIEEISSIERAAVPITPRGVKRARAVIEPITPKSVARPSGSQELNLSQDPKRLPTLNALLAASSRKASPRIKGKATSRESPLLRSVGPSPFSDFSQPIYSAFHPQFQSTQHRANSLPPSPSQPMATGSLSLSPHKMFGTASSGNGFYQSQFNVESRVDQVTAFLDADVWDVEM